MTQTIGILFKTFVIPSDTPIENLILGATEYYTVDTTFLKFVAELHLKQQLGTVHVWR